MSKAPTSISAADDLAARAAAIDLIVSALDHRGGLDEALDRAPFAGLELRDRGLARMIAMTTLRRLGAIDRILQGRLAKPPPAGVVSLLRIGVAQLLFLDIPDFAAVDTTVRLAERDRALRPFKGLINAVLRRLIRDPAGAVDSEHLAPDWLFARWRAAYGEAAAQSIAAMIAEEPATDVTPRLKSDDALADELEASALPGGSLRVGRRGDPTAWPGFADGRWWVQDAAAAIPARLLNIQPGETAVDLCAAPGGKALQLAADQAHVTAVDRSDQRLRRLRQALERTGLQAEVVTADAAAWADPRQFDAVLVDAPCTSTGTFRRNPDVLWGARAGDIGKLAGVQSRLLDAAARRVRKGGRMVYCVCSLEPEEGEAQVETFLARHPGFVLDPIEPGEGGAPAPSLSPKGWLRILPHHRAGGLDGFFAARLSRIGDAA
jgi:16S rRNA (cytosine967-C5)-methyltransferase